MLLHHLYIFVKLHEASVSDVLHVAVVDAAEVTGL